MDEEEIEAIIVTEEESGERLDKILSQRYSTIQSRTYFQHLIDQGCVLLNGEQVKKRIKPKVGDEIQIQFILSPEITLQPEAIPLTIIYEDEDILIVNKPSGMVVHPAIGNWTGTFVNALLHHCQNLQAAVEASASLRPGIVHRLDKDTTGLLMAAKHIKAQQRLVEMFSGRRIHKEYLAICIGHPGNRRIEAPIGRHPVHRKQMAVVETGKEASTVCEVLWTDGEISYVKLILETGRTHQIRVHLKHIGCAILGDPVYGNAAWNRRYGLERPLLHASLLRFLHPITGKEIQVEAPVPADMDVIRRRKEKKS